MAKVTINPELKSRLNAYQRLGLVLAIPAAVLALLVSVMYSQEIGGVRALFFQSYLVAYVFWFGLSIGATALLLIHHLCGGEWSYMIQRIAEAMSRVLFPVALIGFLPIVMGSKILYPWLRLDTLSEAHRHVVELKEPYLNFAFFMERAVVYWVVWLGISYLYNAWSKKLDETKDPAYAVRMKRWAAPCLILYAMTITFAATDWGMSLEPTWFSTIYGAHWVVSQGIAVFAVIALVISVLHQYNPLAAVFRIKHLHHVGNFMLGFTILWSYISFSQFLIIWSGNLPEEISFYLNRVSPGLNLITAVLMFGHFFLPMFMLLFRNRKKNINRLRAIAVWVLVMRVFDMYWNFMPSFYPREIYIPSVICLLLMFTALGGVWTYFFVKELKKRSVVPTYDPRYEAVLPSEAVLQNA